MIFHTEPKTPTLELKTLEKKESDSPDSSDEFFTHLIEEESLKSDEKPESSSQDSIWSGENNILTVVICKTKFRVTEKKLPHCDLLSIILKDKNELDLYPQGIDLKSKPEYIENSLLRYESQCGAQDIFALVLDKNLLYPTESSGIVPQLCFDRQHEEFFVPDESCTQDVITFTGNLTCFNFYNSLLMNPEYLFPHLPTSTQETIFLSFKVFKFLSKPRQGKVSFKIPRFLLYKIIWFFL